MIDSLLKIPINEQDHHLGDIESPVIIVEYGDFECPHSSNFAAVVKQIIYEFDSCLCYVYRHFPLIQHHQHALIAAQAAEAADQQCEFWSFWEFLCTNYDSLSLGLINSYAEGLGLNIHKFNKDIKSEVLLARINKNLSGGIRNGVTSTPTIFINGQHYIGPLNFNSIKNEIQKIQYLQKLNTPTSETI